MEIIIPRLDQNQIDDILKTETESKKVLITCFKANGMNRKQDKYQTNSSNCISHN